MLMLHQAPNYNVDLPREKDPELIRQLTVAQARTVPVALERQEVRRGARGIFFLPRTAVVV